MVLVQDAGVCVPRAEGRAEGRAEALRAAGPLARAPAGLCRRGQIRVTEPRGVLSQAAVPG